MYCINYFVYVHFKVNGITRKVFVANVMKTYVINWRLFTHEHAQDALAITTWYKKAKGISSPFSSETNSL
jgi:hypothetical protein